MRVIVGVNWMVGVGEKGLNSILSIVSFCLRFIVIIPKRYLFFLNVIVCIAVRVEVWGETATRRDARVILSL